MEPLFPMNLATKPIIVTNGDNIVMNKNNNKIKHNNDNPSENETKLSEQNGIFDGHKVCLIDFFLDRSIDYIFALMHTFRMFCTYVPCDLF